MLCVFAPAASAQLRVLGGRVEHGDTGMVITRQQARGEFRWTRAISYRDRLGSLVAVADVERVECELKGQKP